MSSFKTFVLSFLLLFAAAPTYAVSGENHTRSVNDIINEIITSQNVTEQTNIRCDEVTNNQFEQLGDAIMQSMVASEQQHETMDNMMGKEGSSSLQTMHINMGQRYLGCSTSMMGGQADDMMSSSFGSGNRSEMMDNIFGIIGMGGGMFIFWVLAVTAIGLSIAWLGRRQKPIPPAKTALDILKERYAKGEIDQREFETKKQDLI